MADQIDDKSVSAAEPLKDIITTKAVDESSITVNEIPKSIEPPVTTPTTIKSNKYKHILFLLCGLIIVIAGIGEGALWYHKHSEKPTPLVNISVRLAWINNPQFAGMDVAKALGYYKAVGLNVTLLDFENNTDVNKEVSDGQVDYGVSTPIEIIVARSEGEDNKAIAAIYQTSAYSFVIQKNAGIVTPSDFKGKILGAIGANNQAEVTYKVLAANAGLKPSDYTIKSVGYDVVSDFQTNEAATADIYRSDQTYLLNQANIPYTQLFPEQFGFNIYGDTIIASDARIAKYPAQTAAFVKATLEGWEYAAKNQTQTLAILAKYNDPTYNVPGYSKFDLEHTIPLVMPTGDQPYGSMSYAIWNKAYQGVSTSGLLQHAFPVSEIYTTQFIPQT